LDEPELNVNAPLVPLAPPFVVRTTTTPPLADVPSLPSMHASPPVAPAALRPDPSMIAPPHPLVPLPADTQAIPPRPPEAGPDPRLTLPLFSLFAEPELKTSRPPDPPTPPFADRTLTSPLLDAVLASPAQSN